MDLRFIFAEESIQKQVKSKKADLLCLNRIETDEHLYYNHDFKLVLVQLSLCWGKTILYVHIPVLPSHHLKLTRSKLYHWAHIWLLLPTYTMRTHSMFVFIFVACHIPSQTFPYQEHGAKLHPMSEFNNCKLFHSEREFLDLQSSKMSHKTLEKTLKLWRKLCYYNMGL